MKKTILGFVAALSLMLTSLFACASPARMDGYEMLKAQQTLAWELACEAMQADCTQLNQPDVGYMLMEPTSFGYYNYGSPMVAITLDLIGKDESVNVMTHEMIHFLQDSQLSEMDIIFGGRLLWCARERQAFELTYQMKMKYHIPDFYGVFLGEPQPHGLFAPKWEDRIAGYQCP